MGRSKTPSRRFLKIFGLIAALLVFGGAGVGWWMYSHLNGNIDSVDLDDAIGDSRPEKAAVNAQNILVIGSDSRAGANG